MFRNPFRKQFPKVQDTLDTCPRVSITNSMGIDGGRSAIEPILFEKDLAIFIRPHRRPLRISPPLLNHK